MNYLPGEKSFANHRAIEDRPADFTEQSWTGNPPSAVGYRGPVQGLTDDEGWPEWQPEHGDGAEVLYRMYDWRDRENGQTAGQQHKGGNEHNSTCTDQLRANASILSSSFKAIIFNIKYEGVFFSKGFLKSLGW